MQFFQTVKSKNLVKGHRWFLLYKRLRFSFGCKTINIDIESLHHTIFLINVENIKGTCDIGGSSDFNIFRETKKKSKYGKIPNLRKSKDLREKKNLIYAQLKMTNWGLNIQNAFFSIRYSNSFILISFLTGYE